jgi:eukaryotic-like serine/threonine-protein kinase
MPAYVRCVNTMCSASRQETRFDRAIEKDCPLCHGTLVAEYVADVDGGSPETVVPSAGSLDTVVAPVSPWTPPVGSLFAERYRIIRRLDKGGMGTVYLAHDEMLDHDVAVKIPDQGGLDKERFKREARSAAQLRDVRSICQVLDVGDHRGVPYLVMECIPGMTLAKMLQQEGGGLGVSEAIRIVRTLAEALQMAHGRGIIHRDLKPANVMFREDDTPVVMDFGLARREGDPVLTQIGAVMGTLAYMSPEQTRDTQGVRASSDVYTLGVILYETLTGRRPFVGKQTEVFRQICNDNPAPPSMHRPGLDPRLDAICLKAMAKRPEDRFTSMAAFAAELAKLVEKPPPPPPPPKQPRGRLAAIAATLLVLVMAAVSAYVVYTSGWLKTPGVADKGAAKNDPLALLDPTAGKPDATPKVPAPEPVAPTKTKKAGPPNRSRTSGSTGMTFALIQPGRFEMGSPAGEGDEEEQPLHPVEITRAFLLGEYEVTQEKYAKVMGNDKDPSQFRGDGRRPVEGVSWFDAVTFCNAMSEKDDLTPFYKVDGERVTIPDLSGDGYRLPTEAEWEYACRSGRPGKFGFGDAAAPASDHAWFHDNSRDKEDKSTTHPVGGKAKNPWGLHDMQGNVWEWCWDWHTKQYEPGHAKDPTGPAEGEDRMLRGGAYNSTATVLRCAVRNHAAPGEKTKLFGFRVARTYP